jgi:hypothetical protein
MEGTARAIPMEGKKPTQVTSVVLAAPGNEREVLKISEIVYPNEEQEGPDDIFIEIMPLVTIASTGHVFSPFTLRSPAHALSMRDEEVLNHVRFAGILVEKPDVISSLRNAIQTWPTQPQPKK